MLMHLLIDSLGSCRQARYTTAAAGINKQSTEWLSAAPDETSSAVEDTPQATSPEIANDEWIPTESLQDND